MKNLAIIPARGGSKRIPRKNIKEFLGKPIIAYSIEIAQKSDLFSEIMVSTDDKEVAEVAINCGASVPFLRSTETADDFATLADVMFEVLENYKQMGKTFDNVCCILPTAPLITLTSLKEAYGLLLSEDFDSIRPIVKYSYPIQRAFRYQNGAVELFNPEFAKTRSQDLELAYHDAGVFYWFRFQTGFPGLKRGAIIISEIQAQDIDTLEDWKIAELKFKIANN